MYNLTHDLIKKLLTCAACFLLMITNAHALTLDLGASVSQPSLSIRDTATDNVVAEMVDRAAIWPSLSVRGYYAYLTPMLSYRFGDKFSMESPNWMTTVGIGLGIGYLNVRGEAITTGATPQVRKRINDSGFGLSTGVFLEVMKHGWFVRLNNFGPILSNSNFKLDFRDNSITLGKRIDLDFF